MNLIAGIRLSEGRRRRNVTVGTSQLPTCLRVVIVAWSCALHHRLQRLSSLKQALLGLRVGGRGGVLGVAAGICRVARIWLIRWLCTRVVC